MTTQNNENNPPKEAQERLAEIGQILYAGIKRLKDRERSKNNLNQLDYEPSPSLNSIDSKPNQQAIL